MQDNNFKAVGEIDSINGNIVSVRLFNNIKSHMPIIDGIVYRVGQIGSFMKVPLGYANLYGIVTQTGSAAIPDNLKEKYLQDYEHAENTQWINLVLIGEQIGCRFERGITQFPATGDKVHIVTIKDLDIVYGGINEVDSITIGNISVSVSLPARIDMNKFITRHCAIVGSTGSGKSNAVAIILDAIAKKSFQSSRILVIDSHGEYNEVLKDKSRVYKIGAQDKQNELYIPYWALPFNELMKIFPGSLSDPNMEYIREKIVEKKKESAKVNEIGINIELITADSPIPFSIKKLWFELDDFERQTFEERAQPKTVTKKTDGNPEKLISNLYLPASAGGGKPFLNNQAKGILGFLDGIRIKLNDNRYNFLLHSGDWEPDLTGKVKKDLNELLYGWIGEKNPVTILDLSGIPSEIMMSISGSLLKIVYDSLFWGQNTKVGGKQQPLLIVLEEAHAYLKAGGDSISSRTVQTIAKEGRKYGAGLLLITQRPSELDETVLSQCGTIIALRMNNSSDRSHVKSAMQDELQTMVDLLPSLRTGEGLISGEAVKIPSRVKFFKTSHAPKSEDPIPSKQWLLDNPKKDEYKEVVRIWRNQNFKP
ncbi:MAG: ATP-binding protein [bacterium]